MKFWLLMTATALLFPALMLVFGYWYRDHVPQSTKSGYRTRRAMLSKETWRYAHQTLGKIWRRLGWPLLVVSTAVMLVVFGKDEDVVGTVGGILCTLQGVAMVAAFVPVERGLKEHFDENGLPYDPTDWL